MKPGIYTLTADVKNPNKGFYTIDRRQTRDWRHAVSWCEGERFTVARNRDRDSERLIARMGEPLPEGGIWVTVIYNQHCSQAVTVDGAGKEIIEALTPHLQACNDPFEDWEASAGVNEYTLRVLVKRLAASGKIALEDLQGEYAKYMDEE